MAADDSYADPAKRLQSLMLLGHWWQQRTALDAAVEAVPDDPQEWDDAGLARHMVASDLAQRLVDAMPEIVKESGMRPAQAMAAMVRFAVTWGIQIGRELEQQDKIK